MSNLATSLALQNPPSIPGLPPSSTSSQIDAARQWANTALKLGQSIQPPNRTGECDEGCAVATINLGDFAMMEGNLKEARKWWEEGKGLCKGIGMREGVKRVEDALKEIEGKS